eukprot:TRINITY_DN7915_c2_g2_i2.p1 TRINITY_DN7915_c2_g2~~TRINITY_DN7915_c2_g2_i2.p1  ORF type:complete len:188 (-),score=49.37 TRINITY_DN7915_c2_g2_i2:115-678(-)
MESWELNTFLLIITWSPFSTMPPKKAGESIFDRLTDPSSFHGTHKHRFDKDGKGRGIEGRDRIAKGGGPGQPGGGGVSDLSQLTRTGLSKGGTTLGAQRGAGSGKSPREEDKSKIPKKSPRPGKSGGGGIFDRLSDPTTFHGTHKHRFDGDGHGKGLAGRDRISKGSGHIAGGGTSDLSQMTRPNLN